jgi:hypothetical protein
MMTARSASALTVPPREWHLDTGTAPVTSVRRDAWLLGGLIVGIGALWIALALRPPAAGTTGLVAPLGEHGAYLSLAIGIGLALWGCQLLVRRQTIQIDGSCIRVTMRHLAGTDTWTEPLVNYVGVAWRMESIRRRDDWRTLHMIELCHEDPSKTVNVFSSTDDTAARDAWQAWAKALDLAAIRRSPAEGRAAYAATDSVAARSLSLAPALAGREAAAGYAGFTAPEADFRAASSAAIATCSAWVRISGTETSSQSVPRTIGPAPNSRPDGLPSRPIKAPSAAACRPSRYGSGCASPSRISWATRRSSMRSKSVSGPEQLMIRCT